MQIIETEFAALKVTLIEKLLKSLEIISLQELSITSVKKLSKKELSSQRVT